MGQIFLEDGRAESVTYIQAGPVSVNLLRNQDKDGYSAVQVRFGKTLREFKPKSLEGFNVGDTIDVSVFQEGDKVMVSGTSKGHGFQGVVKRHGFHGAPKTHGTKHAHRQPGSIAGIGRGGSGGVSKGKRMAGRMGSDRITIKSTKIIKVMPAENLIAIRGGVPGSRGSLVEIRG